MKRKADERKSAIVESPPNTKRKISKDKSKNYKKNIQTTSKKLGVVDSIGIAKDLTPFWTEFSKEWSQNLSSHTMIGSADSDSNLLREYSKNLTTSNSSWFTAELSRMTMNHQQESSNRTTSFPSLQSLWQKIMNDVPPQTKKEEPKKKQVRKSKQPPKQPPKEPKIQAQKAIRIKIFPNHEERMKLNQWMGTCRWTYNRCLEIYNNRITKDVYKKLGINSAQDEVQMNLRDLRPHVINSVHYEEKEYKWVTETPAMVREDAVKELVTAFKSNFTKLRMDIQKKFFIRFKRRKDKKDSICIPCRDWKRKTGEFAFLKHIKSSETLPDDLRYDSRIIKTKLGEYFICIPQPLEMRSENQAPQSTLGVVALDPGVRTFQTTFDLNSIVTEWGSGDSTRIGRLCHAYDKLQSKWSQVKHNKRYRYKKAGLRIYKKVKNLVGDLHKKMCLWLCKNYRIILLPEFNTQDMVKKSHRKIGSKTARAMMTWSHYSFKQRLLYKSREFPWCHVHIVSEAYTSKTCTCCGHIHHKLGKSKVFKCPACSTVMDRDHNAARNILIRFLTTHNIKSHLFDTNGVGSFPLASTPLLESV